MTQNQLNQLVKLITVCATAFLVVLVGIITFQRIKFTKVENEIQDIDTRIESLYTQKSDLETDISNSKNDLFIEDSLRNDLKIKDGETYFVIEEK